MEQYNNQKLTVNNFNNLTESDRSQDRSLEFIDSGALMVERNQEFQTNLFKETKPFLKWAGGKNQLIPEIVSRMPCKYLKTRVITNYIEPFVGGGALFFYLQSYFQINHSMIVDINADLICSYKVVQKDVFSLIDILKILEHKYHQSSEQEKSTMFYEIRNKFNANKCSFDINCYADNWIHRAAEMIFLNKTCFNGLYRQNSKGFYNVPQGSYKKPPICQTANLLSASQALKETEILYGGFEQIVSYIKSDTFIYYDPPYRPLNLTSSFNTYAKEGFDDDDQRRLASLYKEIHQTGAYQMLSNSDPKNENPEDNFFDYLYSDFVLVRVNAKRMINSNIAKRGNVTEILITNYS